MIDPLLLTTPRLFTFNGKQHLTSASGFFFESAETLFLVTSRHVLLDEESEHFPDRIEIEIHTDSENLALSTGLSILLYKDGVSIWCDGSDGEGAVDVAVIEIDKSALPNTNSYRAFTEKNLLSPEDAVEIGASLLVVGFPLGFHDTLHHLPVVRQAVVSSSFGLRFQGKGYFLTDARTHRGSSGAPVVMRAVDQDGALGDLPWKLLGIHSSRLDMGSRELEVDEALGLNCAWYADILRTLTRRG